MTEKTGRVRLCKVWGFQNLFACKLKFALSVIEGISFCKMFLGIPKNEAAMSDGFEDGDGEVVCLEEVRWKH